MASLFTLPTRAGRESDSAIAKKSNSSAKKSSTAVKVSGGGLFDKINTVRALVEQNLGQYAEDYMLVQSEEVLKEYVNACNNNGVYSIDTETTGLDPMQDEIVGISIYTPDMKPAYIPINHKSYVTNAKLDNQLSVEVIKRQLQRLFVDCVMFNGAFDIRFLRNRVGVNLKCTWDCYLGARLLNENEPTNALKKLHQKYVLKGEGDAFKFDEYFKDISFDLIPLSVAYLYAAHDAKITYELYEYQENWLRLDHPRKDMRDIAWVFHNIEMPCLSVVADIEDTGIAFDFDYANQLHDKYHSELQTAQDKVYSIIDKYESEIEAYKIKNINHKLSDPINIDSPTQIAVFLYDILKVGVIDDSSPRGTGEKILLKIDNEFTKALLEYRAVGKLINTYIDKLPNCVNKNDGRIHCKFNQYGADTGRFSSQDPNLQNIPSHNKDIRKMFKATDGYVLMSSDYSQQEPKMMAQLCEDEKMLKAYREGKDLYAEIAALSFNTTYDNCLEFRPDGTVNPDGKNRRTQAKSILLGVLYGRGVPSIAEQLGTTTEKAQRIKDSVFKGFPAIEKFEQDSIRMAEELGYVTTLWGRKRRLPAMQLPDFEFEWKDGVVKDFDPLNFNSAEVQTEVPDYLVEKYYRKLRRTRIGERKKIFEQANEEGIYVIDNTRNKDTTKVVNARIQGSAADMSKLAMIKVGNDERLKELGFRLLIPVHDELIAECPEENMNACADRFAYLMSIAASDKLTIPISCDVEITRQWYGERVAL